MFFYLLIYVFCTIFLVPVDYISDSIDKYRFIVIFSIMVGVFLYQRKRIINMIKGCYRGIIFKDIEYYKNFKYLIFFFINFILFLVIEKYIKYGIFGLCISAIFILLLEIKDGKKYISDMKIKDYIRYILYQVIGINSSNILFSRRSKLNSEDSFNLHSLSIISMCLASFFSLNSFYFNFWFLILGIAISYLFIFLYRYLYSLNKLRWIGIVIIVVFIYHIRVLYNL